MKKQIAFLVSILLLASVTYAGGVNSLFENALKAGRNNNGRGAYSLQIPSSKNLLVDDVLQYMQEKGYVLTKNYGTKQIIRFGYYTQAISSLEFIPEAELESYIANMPQTNQSGKAVIFPNSRKETVNVFWSGSVKNGSITGNGVGYTKRNNSFYVIKGRFEEGIPTGSCEVVACTPVFALRKQSGQLVGEGVMLLQNTEQRTVKFTTGNLVNGYRSLFMNGKYGFINDKGDLAVPCNYGKVVQEFNSSGFAIVTDPSDNNQEIKISTHGAKLGYSDNQLKINEEKRLAKLAEEKRLEEEKRQKEMKEQSAKLYSEITYAVTDENEKVLMDKVYEYIRRFPEGDRIDMVTAVRDRMEEDQAEAEKNKDYKKWSKGDKICYKDLEKGLVCGVLQSWNAKKTKAQLKIISGHIYNHQTTMTIEGEPLYKDKEIWIGVKDGWHLATAQELHMLSTFENLQGGGGNYQVGNSGNNSGDPKLNSVGRQIYFDESVSYNIGSGNQSLIGSMISSALGVDRVTYRVRYTAVVESVLGDTSVKCVITNARIMDPSMASVNYLKYKKQAASAILEDVGKTRVKQLNEFELVQ